MFADVASYSPGAVQVLAIIAAALFAFAVLVALLRPALQYHMLFIASGLTMLALAIIFLV